jgi:hypothetical protein
MKMELKVIYLSGEEVEAVADRPGLYSLGATQ